MTTGATESLVADGAADGAVGYAAPEGTTIGHVHLRVADLDRAVAFYGGVLGFRIQARISDRAAFLGARVAGGDGLVYHHQIGLNTWESKGGTPPPRGHTGLFHAAILYPSRADLAEAVRRLLRAGVPLTGATDHGISEAVSTWTTRTVTGWNSTATACPPTGRAMLTGTSSWTCFR